MADRDNNDPTCAAKFSNEDQSQRHGMALTIESANGAKTPTFIADETPTPTRFIRNCEEVGLFQDLSVNLQSVNPFDEQFRRAAEAATASPASSTSHCFSDDALHTPHVFPLTAEANQQQTPHFHPPVAGNVRRSFSNLISTLSASECLMPASPLPTPSIIISPPSNPPSDIPEPVLRDKPPSNNQNEASSSASNAKKKSGRKPVIKSNAKSSLSTPVGVNIMPRPPSVLNPVSPPVNDPLQLLLRLPDGRLVQIPAIPVSNEAEPAAQVINTNPPVTTETSRTALSETKMKLKQVLTKARTIGNGSMAAATPKTVPATNASSPLMPSDNSGTDTDQGMQVATQSSVSSSSRRRSYQSASDPDVDEEEGEKRRKFLERNRAAAYRSREKRKHWVSNLEAKTSALNSANKMLQNEVCALRGEVAQLKLQLLAHRDCPVTLALCNQTAANSNNGTYVPNSVQDPIKNLLTVPNQGVPATSQPRQIIILNSNSNGLSVPVINKPPLVVLPAPHPNKLTNSQRTGHGQETSVIISLRSNDK